MCATVYKFANHKDKRRTEARDIRQNVVESGRTWPLFANKGKASDWPTHGDQGATSQHGAAVPLEGLGGDQVAEDH